MGLIEKAYLRLPLLSALVVLRIRVSAAKSVVLGDLTYSNRGSKSAVSFIKE